MIEKITNLFKKIYGYGILISLILSGITVFGYLIAIFIGGDIASIICDFIYNYYFKLLIYASNVIVLIGLLSIYLSNNK